MMSNQTEIDEHENDRDDFASGLSDAFALAAHQLSGLPMAVWRTETDEHACVLINQQPVVWIDANGESSDPPTAEPWRLLQVDTVLELNVIMRNGLDGIKADSIDVLDAQEFIRRDPKLCGILRVA